MTSRSEPLLDLATADDEALMRRFKTLVPIALQQLQEGFGLRRLRVPDPLQAEAALWSACSSFHRHGRDGQFDDAQDPEELAAHLLRIACNRAQRQRRREKQMADATRRAVTRNHEGQTVPLDHEDTAPGPEQGALDNELAAYLREAIDSIKQELQGRPKALAIVQAYLEDMGQPQEAIALALAVNQSTVSRWLDWFRDRIRQMVEEGGIA